MAGDFNGDGLSDLTLTQGVGWRTMPALSNGNGTFVGHNRGISIVSGDTSFPATAGSARVKAVSWQHH